MQVRLDGKAIRGAKDADGNQVRLLAALVGPDAASSVVAAQAEVGKKTNEVPMAAVVLGQIDLNDKIVTADALAHGEGHREPASPKPPDGPDATWTGPSPSSDSHHHLDGHTSRRRWEFGLVFAARFACPFIHSGRCRAEGSSHMVARQGGGMSQRHSPILREQG